MFDLDNPSQLDWLRAALSRYLDRETPLGWVSWVGSELAYLSAQIGQLFDWIGLHATR